MKNEQIQPERRSPRQIDEISRIAPGLIKMYLDSEPDVTYSAVEQVSLLKSNGIPLTVKTLGHLLPSDYRSADATALEFIFKEGDDTLFLEVFRNYIWFVVRNFGDIDHQSLIESISNLLALKKNIISDFDSRHLMVRALERLYVHCQSTLQFSEEEIDLVMEECLAAVDPVIRPTLFLELTNKLAERNKHVEPESPEEINKEAARQKRLEKKKQLLADPETEIDQVPVKERLSFLFAHIQSWAISDRQKIFDLLKLIDNRELISRLPRLLIRVEHDSQLCADILEIAFNDLKKRPKREDRLQAKARAKAHGERYTTGYVTVHEASNLSYYKLITAHEAIADFSGMTPVFEEIGGEKYYELCRNLGVTPEQFNVLQAWVMNDREKEHSSWRHNSFAFRNEPIRDKHFYNDLTLILTSGRNEQRSNLNRSEYIQLYMKLAHLRVQNWGVDGMMYIPPEAYQDQDFIREVLVFHLNNEDMDTAGLWASLYEDITKDDSHNSLSKVLSEFTSD